VVFRHMVCSLSLFFFGFEGFGKVSALTDSVDARIRYALPVFSSHFIPSTFIQSSRTKTDDCVLDSSIGVMIFVLSSSLTAFEGQRRAVQLDNKVTNPMALPVHTRIAHTIEEPEVPAEVGSMEVIFWLNVFSVGVFPCDLGRLAFAFVAYAHTWL